MVRRLKFGIVSNALVIRKMVLSISNLSLHNVFNEVFNERELSSAIKKGKLLSKAPLGIVSFEFKGTKTSNRLQSNSFALNSLTLSFPNFPRGLNFHFAKNLKRSFEFLFIRLTRSSGFIDSNYGLI